MLNNALFFSFGQVTSVLNVPSAKSASFEVITWRSTIKLTWSPRTYSAGCNPGGKKQRSSERVGDPLPRRMVFAKDRKMPKYHFWLGETCFHRRFGTGKGITVTVCSIKCLHLLAHSLELLGKGSLDAAVFNPGWRSNDACKWIGWNQNKA